MTPHGVRASASAGDRCAVLVLILVLVRCVLGPAELHAQRLRELARDQAKRNPGVPLVMPAPPGEYQQKTLPDLTKGADAVVRARLSRVGSYLDPTENYILSDYRILSPIVVVSGQLQRHSPQAPGRGVVSILNVWGGEVTVEGVLIRATNQNFESIRDGGDYLMFLRTSRSGKEHQYEIFYGGIFEISDDQQALSPLLKSADDVFKGTVRGRLSDVISQIKIAAKSGAEKN